MESFTGLLQLLEYENNILMTPVLWLYLTGVKDPWFIYTQWQNPAHPLIVARQQNIVAWQQDKSFRLLSTTSS